MFSLWLKRELWKEISEEEICADRFESVILIWNYDFKNIDFYSLKESTKSKPSIYRFISKCHSPLEETRASWKKCLLLCKEKCQKAGKCSENSGDLSREANTSYICDTWTLKIVIFITQKIYLERDVCICITSKRRDKNKEK